MVFIFLFVMGNILEILEGRMGLFEVNLENVKQLDDFMDLAGKSKWDMWKHPSLGQPARFSTKSDPDHVKHIKNSLSLLNLNLRIINENLDDTIHKELKDNAIQRSQTQFRAFGSGGIQTYFAPHKEYNDWLQSLSDTNPKVISLINIGKSFEGKEMRVLKLSTGNKKESIFIESGIHAREWLGISSAVWILNKIVSGYQKGDPDIKQILDRFDIYALPVANPDGYELTRKGGQDRLWRKNTMPVDNGCFGVDLNRNFDADFGKSGVSFDPCNLIYPGPKAFSAPESRNIRDFVLKIKDSLKLYVSFHAYSQLLLTPWAYTKTPPPDNDEIMRVANIMVDVIYRKSGKKYIAGSPANILYEASGGSFDWVKKLGIKYAYTFEVRPDGRDQTGFVAPIDWISPTGEELYDAMIAAAKSVK